MIFCTQLRFVWMNTSFVAYDVQKLYNKSYLNIVISEYVKGYPKWQSTQIEILGVK
jgi:hypothetical protein